MLELSASARRLARVHPATPPPAMIMSYCLDVLVVRKRAFLIMVGVGLYVD